MKIFAVVIAISPAIALMAEPPAEQQTPALAAILACRDQTVAAERLACFDAKVSDFAAAEKRGDVVVADRQQMRESKKALFGFGNIKLAIFGRGDAEAGPSQIESTIRNAREIGYGAWEFELENGMRWRQTDSTDISPRPGSPVVIKSAALGSYFLRVGKGRWVRAQRVS